MLNATRLRRKFHRFALQHLEDRCVPATAIVSSDADLGTGSLREAIVAINTSLDATNEITFSAGFFSTAKTINLDTPLPGLAVPLSITGLQSAGSNLITISGQNLVTIFNTAAAPTNSTIAFQFLNLTKGLTILDEEGGAITTDDENISIFSCVLANNTAPNGGAINFRGENTLDVRNSRVTGNQATSPGTFSGGGAFYLAGFAANLKIDHSTLAGNTSSGNGGVANLYFGSNLTLTNSTVSGNSAANRGAGFYSFNADVTPNTHIVRNSTLAGNTSGGSGAALCIFYNNLGSVSILNSTISGNTSNNPLAGLAGGAVSVQIGYDQTVNITSSVISGNTHTAGSGNNDLAIETATVDFLNINNSAIGTNKGFTINGSNNGNVPFLADLKLGPLLNNGGTTETLAIIDPLSPLVNTGSNLAPTLSTDQRGGTFERSVGGFTDIGAFELQSAPVAPVVSSFVVNGGAIQRSRITTVTVNFTNPVSIAQFHAAGAVKFTRTGVPSNNQETVGTLVDSSNGLIISPAGGTQSTLTLSFANVDNAGVDFGSLADGRWQLSVVPAGNFSSPNGPTDTQLRRLFGDSDNSGSVDGSDFGFFPPFGTTANNPFDFNANNDIDGTTDFGEFGARFGYTLA